MENHFTVQSSCFCAFEITWNEYRLHICHRIISLLLFFFLIIFLCGKVDKHFLYVNFTLWKWKISREKMPSRLLSFITEKELLGNFIIFFLEISRYDGKFIEMFVFLHFLQVARLRDEIDSKENYTILVVISFDH